MIHGRIWYPDCLSKDNSKVEYKAIIQLAHGMLEFIQRYDEFAEFLTRQGCIVVGNDHLGHGLSISSKRQQGYFAKYRPSETLVKDMHQLRKNIQKRYPELPYIIIGHSMGSYLLRRYLCSYGEGLAGAIFLGTGQVSPLAACFGKAMARLLAAGKGWHFRSKFLTRLTFFGPYRKYDLTGQNGEESWLTRDITMVEKYYRDPRCTFVFTLNAYFGIYDTVSYVGRVKNLRKIPKKLPLLILSGEEDPVGNFGKGVNRVQTLLKQAEIESVEKKLYPGCRHELLNELNRKEIYQDIWNWCREKLDGNS